VAGEKTPAEIIAARVVYPVPLDEESIVNGEFFGFFDRADVGLQLDAHILKLLTDFLLHFRREVYRASCNSADDVVFAISLVAFLAVLKEAIQ
jgi:hypothetical protein